MHMMSSDVARIAQSVLDRCLCKRTRSAARTITRLYDEELRSTGLRPSQVEVLVTVAAKSELSISALADDLDLDRTTLTRNLRPLEKRGLVALSAEGRHRTRLVSLTPAGEAILATAVGHWQRAQEAMERRLGEAGVASVRQAAAAITKSASRTAG
jgi:DNA-binding MarR family transcriptional regulator